MVADRQINFQKAFFWTQVKTRRSGEISVILNFEGIIQYFHYLGVKEIKRTLCFSCFFMRERDYYVGTVQLSISFCFCLFVFLENCTDIRMSKFEVLSWLMRMVLKDFLTESKIQQ